MKIVIAIDSFKGSLSSIELADTIENGIKKVYPNSEIVKLPIADGGEGTVETLTCGQKGKFEQISVNNPLMKPVMAKYGIIGKTAIIEMAQASGLPLISLEERNPCKTSTFGTGQLIKDAIAKGCRDFIVGIGGSATNDAGVGMLQALGYDFFDEKGNKLGNGGEILEKIYSIDTTNKLKELGNCNFLVACDVDNPFYGEKGAAHVFSRQKGADDEMVLKLDEGLKSFSKIIQKETGIDVSNISGAGAAGGLGGAFVSFLNAELKPGVDIILEAIKLEKHIIDADFVITGEGRIDFQSIMGKAPTGVSKLCKKHNVPVIAIAGSVSDDASSTHDYGIGAIFSIMNAPISLEEAMNEENSKKLVEKNTEEIFRLIKICETKFRNGGN
ncbi:MAG: glycerate kinase [Fusobacteriaceae bacterium]|nr:glycerate kinase [Fusobacteriaceae bacterium]